MKTAAANSLIFSPTTAGALRRAAGTSTEVSTRCRPETPSEANPQRILVPTTGSWNQVCTDVVTVPADSTGNVAAATASARTNTVRRVEAASRPERKNVRKAATNGAARTRCRFTGGPSPEG